jgi:hypothetical protein
MMVKIISGLGLNDSGLNYVTTVSPNVAPDDKNYMNIFNQTSDTVVAPATQTLETKVPETLLERVDKFLVTGKDPISTVGKLLIKPEVTVGSNPPVKNLVSSACQFLWDNKFSILQGALALAAGPDMDGSFYFGVDDTKVNTEKITCVGNLITVVQSGLYEIYHKSNSCACILVNTGKKLIPWEHVPI